MKRFLARLFFLIALATSVQHDTFAMLRQPFPDAFVSQSQPAFHPMFPACSERCRNDPVNNFDPLGLITDSQISEVWGLLAAHPSGGLGPSGYVYQAPTKEQMAKSLADAGYTIYSDDFTSILYQPNAAKKKREGLLIAGGDPHDASLFRRLSGSMYVKLLNEGYDISLLAMPPEEAGEDGQQVRTRIKSALNIIPMLHFIGVYGHGHRDLNLIQGKVEITPAEQEALFALGHYAGDCKGVYVTCRPGLGNRAQVFANTIGNEVIGPPPGYSVAEGLEGVSFYVDRPLRKSATESELGFDIRLLFRTIRNQYESFGTPWWHYMPDPQ